MIEQSEILARFSKVYQSGVDEYSCLCPSHNDRNASLGLKFVDDKMIFNCFAGCNPQDILEAVGLTWNDVMPNNLDTEWKPKSRIKFNPFAVMKGLREDYLFIALSAKELERGNTLAGEDVERLHNIARKHKEIYEYLK
jgi:hypothetical protein